ncbi:MAG: hypothetical protein R2851_03245 [Caldilineaceae bacterium]
MQLDVSGPGGVALQPAERDQLITTDRLVEGTVSDAGDVATVQVNFTPGADRRALDGAALYHAFDTTLRTEYFSDPRGATTLPSAPPPRARAWGCPAGAIRPSPSTASTS